MTTQLRTQGLFEDDAERRGPVECLGLTFESDEARRAHFLEKLREKLQDPAFRQIEGFPIGADEDILALSDPPYYTACPNPFLTDFIKHYGEPYDSAVPYYREPFAADVSEGKNDPIYNAHSYHTKVPYKAIMRYILHYTEPGDIVFDGFCGTGMTGVAAQMCGDAKIIGELGYSVLNDGTILDADGTLLSRVGVRSSVLTDLSPAATFIASNYCSPLMCHDFTPSARSILESVGQQLSSFFQLRTEAVNSDRVLEYSVWSDVFICPSCTKEVCYWDASVDTVNWKLLTPTCPNCSSLLERQKLERAWVSSFDPSLGKTIRRAKKVRVWDVYDMHGRRHESAVPEHLRSVLGDSSEAQTENWFPTDEIPQGDKTSDPYSSGIHYVHQYWTIRSIAVLASFLDKAAKSSCKNLLWFLMTSSLDRVSLRNGYRPQHKKNKSRELGGPLPGNLYVPIFSVELNPIKHLQGRISGVARMLATVPFRGHTCIGTQSTTQLNVGDAAVDYIFVDPPFGSNLMYSELSYAMESWLRVRTNNHPEAVVNGTQKKNDLK